MADNNGGDGGGFHRKFRKYLCIIFLASAAFIAAIASLVFLLATLLSFNPVCAPSRNTLIPAALNKSTNHKTPQPPPYCAPLIFYFDLKLYNNRSGNGLYYYQSPNLTTPVAYPGFNRGHPKSTHRNDPVEERGPTPWTEAVVLRMDLATAVRFKITWGRKTNSNKKKKNSVAGDNVEVNVLGRKVKQGGHSAEVRRAGAWVLPFVFCCY